MFSHEVSFLNSLLPGGRLAPRAEARVCFHSTKAHSPPCNHPAWEGADHVPSLILPALSGEAGGLRGRLTSQVKCLRHRKME